MVGHACWFVPMSRMVLAFVLVAPPVLGSPACHTFDGSCNQCASAHTWVSGDNCRYCAIDKHCHAEGSWFNPCSRSQDITNHDQCTDKPAPKPVPTPAIDNDFAKAIVTWIFKHLGIMDVEPEKCVSDVGNAFVWFKNFEADLTSKKYKIAMSSLARGLSALSNSVDGCGVPEVQTKIDALATSIRWANISTSTLDADVKVMVGASDLWKDLTVLASAVQQRDPTQVGQDLSKLLDDWTQIVGGCAADAKACKLIDGLLRVIATVAKDEAGCESAMTPALLKFTAGSENFQAKHYEASIANFSAGLDVLAQATSSDACDFKQIADTIGKLSSTLAGAFVKVESSEAVAIIVGSADVYHELYSASVDLTKGDYTGVGIQLGALLGKLRTSGCNNEACVVLQGILATTQEGFTDFEECKADVENSWSGLQELISELEQKQWAKALDQFGDVLDELSKAINGCGVSKVGSILSDTAKKLHMDSVATDIADVTQVLVGGADIMPDIQKIIVDAQHKSWESLGRDLGSFGDWMTSEGCKSFVCRLVEGLLEQADKTLVDLKPCEDKLRKAEKELTAGAALWGKGDVASAVKYLASGLNQVALSVKACDIEDHLAYIEQEANVFGLGNVTWLDDAVKVLVHGSDFYEELYGAVVAIMNHDYRKAGSNMAIVMNDLSTWTTGHLCTSDICYVVSGVLEFFADLGGDIQKCGSDWKDVYEHFSTATKELVVMEPHFHFVHNETIVQNAIGEIGKGLKAVADAVGDCHMVELAALIAKLAEELGIVPEVKWVEELITILIKGVPIERELSSACEAWSEHSWPAFGYNLIMLVKTLVTPAQSTIDIVV